MEDIKKIIERVQKNNKKASRKIPNEGKQVCKTCSHSGRGCGYRFGNCATGLYMPKK